jgi:hypothetical protein
MSALNDNGVALDGSAGEWRLFGGVAQERRLRRAYIALWQICRAPQPSFLNLLRRAVRALADTGVLLLETGWMGGGRENGRTFSGARQTRLSISGSSPFLYIPLVTILVRLRHR